MKLYSLYISKRERKLYILREMEWDLTEKMEEKLYANGIVKHDVAHFLSKDKETLIKAAKLIKEEWVNESRERYLSYKNMHIYDKS